MDNGGHNLPPGGGGQGMGVGGQGIGVGGQGMGGGGGHLGNGGAHLNSGHHSRAGRGQISSCGILLNKKSNGISAIS